MGLPVEVNNLMMGSLGGYTVGRSLRFRSSASAYLSRTPTATGNRKTWTYSTWLKLGVLGQGQGLFAGMQGTAVGNLGTTIIYQADGTISISGQTRSTSGFISAATTAVYRDPSAWYHIVVAIDTTQATLANGVKVYVNGVQQTVSGSYTQNWDTAVNMTSYVNWIAHVDNGGTASYYGDHYQAEVNLIDGQQLTPSSFGAYDTNGIWQPKKYSGTYGTNGFYLPFSNTTSTTTLVQDSSGNGNNWTANNISLTAGTTYDSMIDSPTVSASSSNYCVLNPIDPTPTANTPVTNGNLTYNNTNASGWAGTRSTFGITSGKWYWESQGSANAIVGLMLSTAATANGTGYPGGDANGWGYGSNNGSKYNNGSSSAYGATWTASTDIVGVAFDADAGTLVFYKNNVSQGTAYTGLTNGPYFPAFGCAVSSGYSVNFGQRPFTYTPPTGYNALNTYNLPQPSIKNGAQYFAATTYTGNNSSTGATRSITNGGNNTIGTTFQPDFVWIKNRSNAYSHNLFDVIRGSGNKNLRSDSTSAEGVDGNLYGYLSSFNSDGFQVTNGSDATNAGIWVNQNSQSYAAWQWKGGGTGVSNTNGSITSTVSANPTAGFSVLTYTGNGGTGTGASAPTVGHGLGVAPSMVIVKSRSLGTENWPVYHTSNSVNGAVYLNSTSAFFAGSYYFTYAPTSSVFSVTANGTNQTNASAATYVAYCFAAVKGYSAMGSYSGNGSTDGPFIYCGFRPRYILFKRTDTTSDWLVHDSARDAYNIQGNMLNPNLSGAENTSAGDGVDFLSNGFKLRTVGAGRNASGGTYIYAAFAENPFNSSRAR